MSVGLFITLIVTTPPIAWGASQLDPDKLLDVPEVCEKAERAMQSGLVDPQDFLEAGSCTGFMWGFVQTEALRGPDAPKLFCAPAPVKMSDLFLIFNAFLRKDPKWRVTAREEPASALFAALQDAWPCPTGPARN
jgi:hypothetical protein